MGFEKNSAIMMTSLWSFGRSLGTFTKSFATWIGFLRVVFVSEASLVPRQSSHNCPSSAHVCPSSVHLGLSHLIGSLLEPTDPSEANQTCIVVLPPMTHPALALRALRSQVGPPSSAQLSLLSLTSFSSSLTTIFVVD